LRIHLIACWVHPADLQSIYSNAKVYFLLTDLLQGNKQEDHMSNLSMAINLKIGSVKTILSASLTWKLFPYLRWDIITVFCNDWKLLCSFSNSL
jgi:hypothetical protein